VKTKPPTKTVAKSSNQHSSKKPIDPKIYDVKKHRLAKGHPKLGGRAKGTKNKFTTLKDAFINAFQRIGGEDALVEFCTPKPIQIRGKKGKIRTIDIAPERKETFFKMIVPMLPKEVAVTGPEGQPLIPPKLEYVFVPSPEKKP